MRPASLLLFPLALLLGCATTEHPDTAAPQSAKAAKTDRAFDVPALLGLNADQIAGPLAGKSIRPDRNRTPRELPTGASEINYTYWHDTTGLVVSYDPATLTVNSFFLKTQYGLTTDYAALLKLANVSPYDKRLTIEPIASAADPQRYTGVKLVPRY